MKKILLLCMLPVLSMMVVGCSEIGADPSQITVTTESKTTVIKDERQMKQLRSIKDHIYW